jgi:hypothetical protein
MIRVTAELNNREIKLMRCGSLQPPAFEEAM